MKRGDHIRWNSTDDQGNFTHTGIVTEITDKTVSMKTKMGLFTVPLNDGSFEILKDAGDACAELMVSDEESSKPASAAPSRGKRSSKQQGSKLERAIAIAKTMPNASQKELIAAFMEQLDMTKAGATTYYYNVKKKM
jgi:hypothetical protein